MKKIQRRLGQVGLLLKCLLCIIISPIFYKKYKNVWLISERGDEAKDNGYVFYRYLKKYHNEINIKYVISKHSSDIHKIDKEDIIIYKSFAHILCFINSKFLISTHIMGMSPDSGMFTKLDRKGLVYSKGKRIFLQHGVIYNYIPPLEKINVDLFVTSSPKEKKFIAQSLNIDEEKIICTGLPRYDNLIKNPKDYILVTPTWRSYLFYNTSSKFKQSLYFNKWNDFLNNKELSKLLEKNNLKLYFYPHYETQKFCECFDINDKNIIIADSKKYEISKLLRECKIYITDYSSTLFDIAYLKTPSIYFQFDYNEFYSHHYKEGYLNLPKNGFGLSVDNIDDLIKEIKNICKRNYKIDNLYENRIDKFFLYHDQKQCDRIFEEIIKLKDLHNE